MELAFVLYKYFPYGGLQRDFLKIAFECQQRGHSIRVYTMEWEADRPKDFNIIIVPVSGMFSHIKNESFVNYVKGHLQANPVHCIAGFNKIPGLDIYYAADSCYEDKVKNQRPFWYKYTHRYKHFSKYEQAIFGRGATTKILLISETEQKKFVDTYKTEPERMILLPPGISKDRKVTSDAPQIRAELRSKFNIIDDECLLLMVGSGFKIKGLDRAIRALASLPDGVRKKTKLIVIGQDNPKAFLRLATRLGVASNLTILKGRDDIPHFLQGADILIHPAYSEAAGIILLEAVVAGLPVLVTDVCGYAHYIEEAEGGLLVKSPFRQEELNEKLLEMIESDQRPVWRKNCIKFSEVADIYNLHNIAAEYIIATAIDK